MKKYIHPWSMCAIREAKYMNIIKVLSHCSCSNICWTIQHFWGDHSKHYKYSLSLLIVFYLLLIIVMFHPRPSRNVPSGERSGDSAWGEKWSLYCHEWQRETLWFGKNWSGVANLMKYVWTEIKKIEFLHNCMCSRGGARCKHSALLQGIFNMHHFSSHSRIQYNNRMPVKRR